MPRNDINHDKQKKRMTSVGYPKNNLKFFAPVRIITQQLGYPRLQETEMKNAQSRFHYLCQGELVFKIYQ